MCGLGGVLPKDLEVTEYQSRLKQMLNRLSHRGPDDSSMFVDPDRSIGMVHARLAILDLSPLGRQPMTTVDGRWTLVFNGEIYNFRELRNELLRQGVVFRSESDTEVLLELFRLQGVQCLGRLKGMFAFAVWDQQERTLVLARDPLGIKPLYVWEHAGSWAFASEVRALLTAQLAPAEIDPAALAKYLLFGSVQEPDTLVKGMRSVPAGSYLQVRAGKSKLISYWQPQYHSDAMSFGDAASFTRQALVESVSRHFVSDVPVGVFLSGGMDSTAILAAARVAGVAPEETFSISFDDPSFDEGGLAQRTAKHFGARHHDWRMRPDEGDRLVAEFLASLDLPTHDGFNTWCVAKFVRECGIKVALSGVGGDELFGKYPSYRRLPTLMRIHRVARGLGQARQVMIAAIRRWVPAGVDSTWARLDASLCSQGNPVAAYWAARAFFTPTEVEALVHRYCGVSIRAVADVLLEDIPTQPTELDVVSYLETTRYLKNQLLRDSDCMSMAHGLELRTPLVDQTLFDRVNRIPATIRLRAGRRLLSQALPEIPEWVVAAPKKGFRFPFQKWFTGEWRDRFTALDRECPVRLGSWYRTWSLFTLNHFIEANGIGLAGCGIANRRVLPAIVSASV